MLHLQLGHQPGKVEMRTDETGGAPLHRLRLRFATAETIDALTITVGLDDFLLNVAELTAWPDPSSVTWEPALAALVRDNFADAALVEESLADAESATSGDQTNETNAEPPAAEGWDGQLTREQKRDLGRLLSLKHGANFSVPGSGKTRVGLALFDLRRRAAEVEQMLVVCPKSAFESWRLEAMECFGDSLSVAAMDRPVVPAADVVLINYERLPESVAALAKWLQQRPSMMVLDEAHRMKLGAAGAWGSACYRLGPYARRRLILTGTPAPNGRSDLENLFSFVWPGQGRQKVASAVGGNSLAEASRLLKPLFTRTTKAELEIAPMDPPRIRSVILPELHRRIYDALAGLPLQDTSIEGVGRVVMYLLMASTSPTLLALGSSRYEPLEYRVPPLTPPGGTALAQLMRDLPQYEQSPKYTEAMAIVEENAQAGRKTLVWSTFVRNLTTLERLMARYRPAVIHGGTIDREEQLRRFREDPRCMVLLSNPATLGEGVSLHHTCHEAVYIDRDFAAGRYLQSLDRIHRLGLPPGTRTRISLITARDTIDEIVASRLDSKIAFMLRILDDPAVEVLADLDEEPTLTAGMDDNDRAALFRYLAAKREDVPTDAIE